MTKYILPVAPFEQEEPYVRFSENRKAVLGINDDGLGYLYIEEAQPTSTGLTVRWVPEDMPFKFEHGVCKPIEVYWEEEHYLNGVFIVKTGKRTVVTINHPDMVELTPSIGLMFLKMMVNGFERSVKGFDDQPVFRGDGVRIPDVVYQKNEDGTDVVDAEGNKVVDEANSYDTTLPPSNTYDSHKVPLIISVEEPVPADDVPAEPAPSEPAV